MRDQEGPKLHERLRLCPLVQPSLAERLSLFCCR